MGMVQLLFGFNGRINRAQYWTVGIAAGFIAVLCAAAIALFTGAAIFDGMAAGLSEHAIARDVLPMLVPFIPLFGVMMWIGTALQVKRFHDRGQSGFWVMLPMGLGFFVGIGLIILLPVLWLVQLGFLVNLGFLPGEAGDNRFGGPPGTPGAAGAPSSSPRPGKAAAAASSMFGAEQAMERALAEQQMRAKAPPAPRTAVAPKPAAASPAQPSFGRRVVQ